MKTVDVIVALTPMLAEWPVDGGPRYVFGEAS